MMKSKFDLFRFTIALVTLLSNEMPENRTIDPKNPARMNIIAPDTPGEAIATLRITVERMNQYSLD